MKISSPTLPLFRVKRSNHVFNVIYEVGIILTPALLEVKRIAKLSGERVKVQSRSAFEWEQFIYLSGAIKECDILRTDKG